MNFNDPWVQFAFGATLLAVGWAARHWGLSTPAAGTPQDAMLKLLEGILNRKDIQIEQMQAMISPRPPAEAAGNVQMIQAGEAIVGVRFRVQVLPQEVPN